MLEVLAGLLTIGISACGAGFAFRHWLFYRRSNAEISKRMRRVFFTDGLIYTITLFFGVWAYYRWSFDIAIIAHWVRIPILIANIWASYRLYSYYKMFKG